MRSLNVLALMLAIAVPGLAQAIDAYVAPGGDDLLNDCLSAATPCATIQAGVDKAVAPATVHVATGTYFENVIVDKDVLIDGAGAGSTVVDGGELASVVTITAPSTVTLSNLTVTHGRADRGGGVHNLGNLTLVDCEVRENYLTDAVIGAKDGAGIFSILGSSLTLTRVDVVDNDGMPYGGGGGLYSRGTTLIEDSVFTGNIARAGGGAEIQDTATIRTSLFENNTATIAGSAIKNGGDLTLENSILRNNEAISEGGTIFTDGDLLVDRTLIANNVSQDAAGALFVEADVTVVLNSTITGNTAVNECGAICTFADMLVIINSTIARNSVSAATGLAGGINADAPTFLRNTILAENTAAVSPDCAGTLTSDGYNLIGDDDGCAILGDLTGNLVNLAPGLATLQDNGGPTETLGLFCDSPAIDAGDPAGCVDNLGLPLTVDQRGAPRPLGARCDIGAFEGDVSQAEICDLFDNDCDGSVDEGFDVDGDGVSVCAGDCDDGDADNYPGNAEVCDLQDNDCDGVVDNGFDLDGDGVSTCDGDCDDGDDANFPGNPEVCDLQDNDCDGAIDEDLDADGDGVSVCDGDCDDGDDANYPGNVEVCDLQDNDCDGVVDNGFDLDGDGVSTCAGDCDDGNAANFPGNVEVCDLQDNDCDGAIDEGLDGDGDGVSVCDGDCDDGDAANYPGNIEVCDLQDNDCDGVVDNGFDLDGDGFSSCAGDCDDGNADRFPGNPEVCDGLDNNCDGLADAEGEDDPDMDGVPTCLDNCPDDANGGQLDGDIDGVGDACDACPDDDGDGLGVSPDGCSSIDSYVCAEVDDLLGLTDLVLSAIGAPGVTEKQAEKLQKAADRLIEAVDKLHEGKIDDVFKKMKDAIDEIQAAQGEGYPESAANDLMNDIAQEARWYLDGLLFLAQSDPNFDQDKYDQAQEKYDAGVELLEPPPGSELEPDYKESVHKFEESAKKLDEFLVVQDPCDLLEATATIAGELEDELEDALSDLTDWIGDPATPACALDRLEQAEKKVMEALDKIKDGVSHGHFKHYEEALGKLKDAIDELEKIQTEEDENGDPCIFDTDSFRQELAYAAEVAVDDWYDLAVEKFGATNSRVVKAKAKIQLGDTARDDAMYMEAVKQYGEATKELEDLF